jgi:hypothetical protein
VGQQDSGCKRLMTVPGADHLQRDGRGNRQRRGILERAGTSAHLTTTATYSLSPIRFCGRKTSKWLLPLSGRELHDRIASSCRRRSTRPRNQSRAMRQVSEQPTRAIEGGARQPVPSLKLRRPRRSHGASSSRVPRVFGRLGRARSSTKLSLAAAEPSGGRLPSLSERAPDSAWNGQPGEDGENRRKRREG